MDEKRVVRELGIVPQHKQLISPELVASAREKFEEAYLRFQSLKAEYRKLKEEKKELRSKPILSRMAS